MKQPIDWKRIKTYSDAETAADIFPQVTGPDDYFWNVAAQAVLASVIFALESTGRGNDAEMDKALTLPVEDIARLCESFPEGGRAYMYISDASSKITGLIIAFVVQAYYA